MAQIHIEQAHRLGLARARTIAAAWMQQAHNDWNMTCALQSGAHEDVISFSRSGVQGQLRVSATQFVLEAKLGFLLGQFQARIEAQVRSNLQALLADEPPGQPV